MIFDSVQNLTRYADYSSCFDAAVKFLQKTNLVDIPDGKYIIIEDTLTCTVVDRELTETPDFWEAHREYIDIHIVVRGTEKIMYAPGNAEVWCNTSYNSASDSIVTRAEMPNGIAFSMRPGDAIVFFPGELHKTNCPACETGSVKKIILKVIASENK